METLKEVKERLEFYFTKDGVSTDWVGGYVSGLYEADNITEGVYIQLEDWLEEKKSN